MYETNVLMEKNISASCEMISVSFIQLHDKFDHCILELLKQELELPCT